MLDAAAAYTGTVSGFTLGDTIDLVNLSYGSNTNASFSGDTTGGVLSVGNGVDTAHIALFGNFAASSFTLGSDGHGGTTTIDSLVSVAPLLHTNHA